MPETALQLRTCSSPSAKRKDKNLKKGKGKKALQAAPAAPHNISVLILGSKASCKTTLSHRLLRPGVPSSSSSTDDLFSRTVVSEEAVYDVEIMDTSYAEEFQALKGPLLKRGDAFIFAFALHRQESLEELEEIYDFFCSMVSHKRVPKVLVGLQCPGEQRVVSQEDCERMGIKLRAKYLECDLSSEQSVDSVLFDLVEMTKRRHTSKSYTSMLSLAASMASIASIPAEQTKGFWKLVTDFVTKRTAKAA